MRQIALVLVVAQLCSACSFVFVSGPPPNHAQLPYVECTESRVVPILDGVWAALQTANLLIAAGSDGDEFEDKYGIARGPAMGLYGGFAALGIAGLAYGWARTSSCHEAKKQWMLRGGGGGMGPAPGTWPPPATPQQ